MTFRRDLETWTADQVALRGLSGLSSDIRRLLRGADVVGVGLSPVDSNGLPSEILEAFPPSRDVPTEPPPKSSTWICWPSADNAPYGWGDPYGPNPPLGTIQSSFSDTAHIAREIDASDGVTHGVNKIAAPRDWRDSNSLLVVSWDSGAIYSGGSALIATGSIAAACVRNPSGASNLLWLDTSTNPWRVYSQQCEIVDDVVVGVIGVTTFCTLGNSGFAEYWSEFNDGAGALIVCSGNDPQAHVSESYSIPASFSGQNIDNIREAETGPYDITWSNNNNYDGSRKYLIKSQYIAGVLTHCWANVIIHESIPDDVKLDFRSYESLGVTPDSGDFVTYGNFYQASGSCGESQAWIYSDFNAKDGYMHLLQRSVFNVNVELEIDTVVIESEKLVEDSSNTTSWCQSYPSGSSIYDCRGTLTVYDPNSVGRYPAFPGPDGSPCPTRVVQDACALVTSSIDYQSVRDYVHKSIYYPQNTLDLKTQRFCKFDCGYVDVANSSNWTKYFKVSAFRNGLVDSVEIEGDFGEADLPVRTTIINQSRLELWLDKIANSHFPNTLIVNDGSKSQGVSIDVDDVRCAFSAWAQSETDGNFKYVNFLENADINVLLSIDGQINPSIVIDGSSRYIGVLMKSV